MFRPLAPSIARGRLGASCPVLRLLVLSATAAACHPSAGRAPSPPTRSTTVPGVHATVTRAGNGMHVVVIPDPRTDLVEVDMRYAVGSAADPQNKAGLAHLVEHLRFEMQPDGFDRPSVIDRLEEITTNYDAETDWDRTHYRATAPRAALEELIAVEMQRLQADCTAIAAEVLAREREVIRNELRERERAFVGSLFRLVYAPGHPYHRKTGGDEAHLGKITMADVCGFLRRHYVPERATLIVAGHTTAAEVRTILAKYARSGPTHEPTAIRPAPAPDMRIPPITHPVEITQPVALVVMPRPPFHDPDGLAAGFALRFLRRGLAELQATSETITDVGVVSFGGVRAPVALAWAAVDDRDALDAALAEVEKQVAHLGDRLLARRAKNDLEVMRYREMTAFLFRLGTLAGRTSVAADEWQFRGGRELIEDRVKKLDRLSLAQVIAAARRMTREHRVIRLIPTGSLQALGEPGDLRFAPPSHEQHRHGLSGLVDAALPPRDRGDAVTRSREFTLENGLRVLMYPHATIPVVDMRLIFRGGSAHEPTRGVAELAAKLLAPTATDGDHLTSSYNFRQVGARMGTFVDAHTTVFWIHGMSSYVDVLIERLHGVVTGGRYRERRIRAFARALKSRPDNARQRRIRRHEQAFRSALLGAMHPYARPSSATVDSIKNIHVAALRAFRDRHYRADNATLVIAGRFDPDLVEEHIRYWFRRFPGGGAVAPPSDPPAARPRPTAARPLGFELEDRDQVHVRVGFPTHGGDLAELGARLILRELLAARLQAIRRRLGASYRISVAHKDLIGPGYWDIRGWLDAERSGEGLAEILDIIAALRRAAGGGDRDSGKDAFAGELARARHKVMRSLGADKVDAGSVAGRLSFVAQRNTSIDFYRDLIAVVADISADDVRALAGRELAPENRVVLCAGDRDKVEKTYARTGMAPPIFVH